MQIIDIQPGTACRTGLQVASLATKTGPKECPAAPFGQQVLHPDLKPAVTETLLHDLLLSAKYIATLVNFYKHGRQKKFPLVQPQIGV